MLTTNMTVDNFVNKEIALWGFDEIEALFISGYEPVNTDHGWRWLAPKSTKVTNPSNSTLTVAN